MYVSIYCQLGFPGGSAAKCPSAVQETWVRSSGQEDPMEEVMTTDSSIFYLKSYEQWNLVGHGPCGCKRIEYDLVTKQQHDQLVSGT